MSLVLYVLILIECDMIHYQIKTIDSLESDASKQLSEFLKNRFRKLPSVTRSHQYTANDALMDSLPRLDTDVSNIDVSLVEPVGIEPTTSCLQSRRSPS